MTTLVRQAPQSGTPLSRGVARPAPGVTSRAVYYVAALLAPHEATVARRHRHEAIEREFAILADWWHEATDLLSSPERIAEQKAYQRIIDLGPEAVPLILDDLRIRGGLWFEALERLTGENPIPPEMIGNIKAMKAAWLEWGRKLVE